MILERMIVEFPFQVKPFLQFLLLYSKYISSKIFFVTERELLIVFLGEGSPANFFLAQHTLCHFCLGCFPGDYRHGLMTINHSYFMVGNFPG